MKERLIAPDFIKGICIVLMIYGHITYIGSLSDYQNKITDIIYTFHMPLFLIISGYFFSISKNVKPQLENIARRIAIPYIIFISIYLIGLILVKRIGIPTNNVAPQTFIDFIDNVFLHPSGAYWFLHSLILINLTLIIANKISPEKDTFLLYLLSFIFFILLDLNNLVLIRTSIYFMVGYILQQLTSRNLKLPNYSPVILIAVSLFFYTQSTIYTFSPVEVINCLVVMAILWSLSNSISNLWPIRAVAWIGQNTLIILLLHAFFIIIMKPSKTLFLNIDPSGIVYSVVATTFTLIMCILSSKILDTLRISKYLFNTDKLYKSFKSS